MMKIPLPVAMLSVTFAIIYLTMCPVLNPWLVDGMLFHPDKEIDAEIDPTRLSSIGAANGREIAFDRGMTGWIFQNPKSKYIVLFSHGNAGNLSHRIDKVARLLRCGQSVFIWDYPGFGHSAGSPSLKSIAGDAVCAYDCLIGLGYSPDQIILYGESVGSGINAEISTRRKVKAIIIDSGFTSLQEIAREKCPIFCLYPNFLMPRPSMEVRQSLRELPCLIIHAKDDEIIPYHHALQLHEADPHSTLISLPKSSHNFVTAQDAITEEVALKKFFAGL